MWVVFGGMCVRVVWGLVKPRGGADEADKWVDRRVRRVVRPVFGGAGTRKREGRREGGRGRDWRIGGRRGA